MSRAQITAIENLMQLGFTMRQAEFLFLAGTHTGVFTAQQYRVFANIQRGAAQHGLIRRLASLGFACSISLNKRDELFHLRHKGFYRAIGAENSRLRRGMSASLTRQRLRYMDYLVLNSDAHYLTSEAEKSDTLRAQFGIPEELLPRKTYISSVNGSSTVRLFPEHFPLFVWHSADHVGLGVVYGEDPANSFQAFRKFILRNQSLLAEVPSLRFVHVTSSRRRQKLALALLSSLLGHSHVFTDPDLERYFDLRLKLDRNEESSFTNDDLAFWKHAYPRFRQPKYEAMYAEFCQKGSLNAVPCAGSGRSFEYIPFAPTTTLQDGLDAIE